MGIKITGYSRYMSDGLFEGIALGGSIVCIIGIIAGIYDACTVSDQEKYNKILSEINSTANQTIVEQMGAKDALYNISSVRLVEDNGKYLMKLGGSAILDNDGINFLTISYQVDKDSYVSMQEMNDDIRAGEIESLENIASIMKNAENVKVEVFKYVATNYADCEEFKQYKMEGEPLVLNVTKPQIVGEKVVYNVCFAQYAKTETMIMNERGFLLFNATVEFDMTDELAQSPLKVFDIGGGNIKVDTIDFVSYGNVVNGNVKETPIIDIEELTLE